LTKSRNTWHIPHCTEFDLDRAKECAEILCGTHDFVAFRGAFRGSERGKVQDTVCTLFEVSINEITRNSDSSALCKTFCVDITGDRFLYKQVRLLVGTIVQYARSEHIDKSDISKILDNREWHGRSDHSMDDQNKAPFPKFCAPPQGLSLKSVEFGDEWSFDWIVQKPERVETILVVEG
jgi:tRNA pseudouridine(38-40) synthase